MNRKPAKTDARIAETLRTNAAQRGMDREAHFASGGTTAMWRGTRSVTPNHKAKAAKAACRGQVRE